jgi:hypothetical protein
MSGMIARALFLWLGSRLSASISSGYARDFSSDVNEQLYKGIPALIAVKAAGRAGYIEQPLAGTHQLARPKFRCTFDDFANMSLCPERSRGHGTSLAPRNGQPVSASTSAIKPQGASTNQHSLMITRTKQWIETSSKRRALDQLKKDSEKPIQLFCHRPPRPQSSSRPLYRACHAHPRGCRRCGLSRCARGRRGQQSPRECSPWSRRSEST